jgi:hypothetical protein
MTTKARIKTSETGASVEAFLDAVPDAARRADAKAVCKLMEKVTREKPKMWGSSIVGFGNRVLKYADGRELDWIVVGFAPRKANTVLYLMDGYAKYQEHLKKLGKHKTGVSCLYLNRLADIDMKVLEDMVAQSVKFVRGK